MRVVFLDVDGVITKADGSGRLDEPKLRRLEKLHQQTGCIVCISSNWRLFQQLVSRLELALQQHGGIRVIGATPDHGERLHGGAVRPEEIMAWLRSWRGEPIESWCAVDDRPLLEEQGGRCLEGHFVQVDESIGLTDHAVERMAAILTPPEPDDPELVTVSQSPKAKPGASRESPDTVLGVLPSPLSLADCEHGDAAARGSTSGSAHTLLTTAGGGFSRASEEHLRAKSRRASGRDTPESTPSSAGTPDAGTPRAGTRPPRRSPPPDGLPPLLAAAAPTPRSRLLAEATQLLGASEAAPPQSAPPGHRRNRSLPPRLVSGCAAEADGRRSSSVRPARLAPSARGGYAPRAPFAPATPASRGAPPSPQSHSWRTAPRAPPPAASRGGGWARWGADHLRSGAVTTTRDGLATAGHLARDDAALVDDAFMQRLQRAETNDEQRLSSRRTDGRDTAAADALLDLGRAARVVVGTARAGERADAQRAPRGGAERAAARAAERERLASIVAADRARRAAPRD